MRYGGNFSALNGFDFFFGGSDLAKTVKPKYGGNYSAVMRYGGNFSTVNDFSFFDGNDFGGDGETKIWR